MNRLSLNQTDVDARRDLLREPEAAYEQPCPGSVLKHDDDVQWLGFIDARVLWGHPDPHAFYAYSPDVFGGGLLLDVAYVNDRAPLDPNESPLPLYPEENAMRTAATSSGTPDAKTKAHKPLIKRSPTKDEVRAALQKVLASLPDDAARKQARAYFRKHRADIDLGPDAP